MARTRRSIQPLNLYKYDVLIEDRGPRSDYFKISQFDGYFYGGRNAFLVAGAGVLQPNSKILVEVLNVDGNLVYTVPVSDFIEANSRLIQTEVYPDTPIGVGKLILLGCATTYLDGTPIPDEWKNKYNVRWISDVTISPLVNNKTPIRFLNNPSVVVEEKFYSLPSQSILTEKINVPVNIQISPKHYNVSQIGYTIKLDGPINTKFKTEYLGGIITGSIFLVPTQSTVDPNTINFSSLNPTQVSLPITKIFNSNLAESQGTLIFENNKTLISEIYLSSSGLYTTTIPSLGSFAVSGGVNLQYNKLETFGTSSNISYAKLRIVDAKTLSGEINKIRVSYKIETEPGDYVVLSDVNVGVNELLTVDTGSRVAQTGKLNTVVVNDYWYTATMSLNRNEINPTVPSYYISSSLIGNKIINIPCCDDLLDAINETPAISNGKFVDDVSYFIGTRTENSVQLFPRTEYTLKFDALVAKNSASVTLDQSDYSLQVYLVQQDSTSRILEASLRGQLIGTLTPSSKFLKQNFEGTEFNFTPKIIAPGNFGLRFIVYGGNWNIANISLKPAEEPLFSPDEIDILIPNINYTNKFLSYKLQYLDVNNNSAGIETISTPVYFSGSESNSSTDATIINGSNIAFKTAGTIKAFIAGSGNFGIGTVNPGALLHVQGAISASSMTLTGTATVQTLVQTSTIQLKTNITPLESTLNSLKKIQPSRFNWVGTNESDIGLIAEWIEPIYPELVKRDFSGNVLGINYGKLSVVLLQAIKELTDKIEILENK